MFTENDLIDAVKTGNIKQLRLCLVKKIDPNAVDSEQCPAIILATKGKNACIVAYLLVAGADLSMRDVYGKTALDYASVSTLDIDLLAIKSLLEKARDGRLLPIKISSMKSGEEVAASESHGLRHRRPAATGLIHDPTAEIMDYRL